MRLALALLLTTACDPGEERTGRVRTVTFGGGLCAYGSCWEELSVEDSGGFVLEGFHFNGNRWSRHATPTPAGLADLADAEADVGDRVFDDVYGCPGCADGPAITVTLWAVDTRNEVTTTYEGGSPPEGLDALDALAADLRDALFNCDDAAGRLDVPLGCAPVVY